MSMQLQAAYETSLVLQIVIAVLLAGIVGCLVWLAFQARRWRKQIEAVVSLVRGAAENPDVHRFLERERGAILAIVAAVLMRLKLPLDPEHVVNMVVGLLVAVFGQPDGGQAANQEVQGMGTQKVG